MVKKPVEFPKLLLKRMKELDSVQGGLSLLAGWPTFTQMYQQVFVWVSIFYKEREYQEAAKNMAAQLLLAIKESKA